MTHSRIVFITGTKVIESSVAVVVSDLGADVVIDYKTRDFDEELSEFDVVLDLIGGETLEKSFKVLKSGGRLVPIMGDASESYAATYDVEYQPFYSWSSGEMLSELALLLADGRVRPVIDRTFSLDDAPSAYALLDSGRAKGKIVGANLNECSRVGR